MSIFNTYDLNPIAYTVHAYDDQDHRVYCPNCFDLGMHSHHPDEWEAPLLECAGCNRVIYRRFEDG